MEQMFTVMSDCQILHPDPDDSEPSDEDFGDEFGMKFLFVSWCLGRVLIKSAGNSFIHSFIHSFYFHINTNGSKQNYCDKTKEVKITRKKCNHE